MPDPRQQIIDRINAGDYQYTYGPGSPGATTEDRNTVYGNSNNRLQTGNVALRPADYNLFTPAERAQYGIADYAPASHAPGDVEGFYGGDSQRQGVSQAWMDNGGEVPNLSDRPTGEPIDINSIPSSHHIPWTNIAILAGSGLLNAVVPGAGLVAGIAARGVQDYLRNRANGPQAFARPPSTSASSNTEPPRNTDAPDQGLGGWGQPMGYFGYGQNPLGSAGVHGEGGSFFGGRGSLNAPGGVPVGHFGEMGGSIGKFAMGGPNQLSARDYNWFQYPGGIQKPSYASYAANFPKVVNNAVGGRTGGAISGARGQ